MLLGLVGCILLGLGITTGLLAAEMTPGLTLLVIAMLLAGVGSWVLDILLIIK